MEKDEKKFIQLISEIPNIAVQGYNKKREVIFWNKASETIYGYSEDEAIGKKLEDLIIPDFMRDAVIKGINNWYKKEVPIPAEKLPLRRKNGTTAFVYSSHVMLNENTKEPEMFCIDIDLTDQVKKDEELKQKDKILAFQSKLACLGEMFDNIAHQWRQPLGSLMMIIQSFQTKMEFGKLSFEFVEQKTKDAVLLAENMSNTLDDFQNFFSPNKDKVKFSVKDCVLHAADLSKYILEKENIKLNIIIMNDLNIYGYYNELSHVVLNMISNSKDALKNIDKEKAIKIVVKEYRQKARILIYDNGDGVDEKILPHIFEPYYTTKYKSAGTGIGLYMCKQIIETHMNGNIKCKNVYNKINSEKLEYGALFIVDIPLDNKNEGQSDD